MDSKLFFSLSLVFFSWAIVGFSENLDGDDLSQLGDLVSKDLSQGVGSLLQATGGGADPVGSIPCIQKLLPCQPYLHSPKPPATCCFPLKVMVSNDSECLCTVFNNPVVLKSLNLTQDEALKLPHACGANADISLCKNVTASPPSSPVVDPSTAAAPAPASAAFAEGLSNSSSNSPPKSAAYGISHFGGSGFIAFFIVLFVSAFQA